jgi:hypothetical protein
MSKNRPKVSIEQDVRADPVYLDRGYVVPARWQAHAEIPDSPAVVDFTIEIVDRRALATDLSIHSPEGISWDLLATLPIRDMVGTACLAVMRRVKVDGEATSLVDVAEDDPEALDVIRRLIGYKLRPLEIERSASLTARAGIRASGEVVKRRRTT